MTTQEAIDEIPFYTRYQLGNLYGESPTTAQLVRLLNWAVRVIGKAVFLYKPNIALTLEASEGLYDLHDLAIVERKVVRPFTVIVNGVRLWNRARDGYGVWTLPEFESDFPQWMIDQTDAAPTIPVYYDHHLLLYKRPADAYADKNFISGPYYPLDRTADADVGTGLGTQLDIPFELHEAACKLAAVKAGEAQVSERSAWEQLSHYNSEWAALAHEMRRENLEAVSLMGSSEALHASRFSIWI